MPRPRRRSPQISDELPGVDSSSGWIARGECPLQPLQRRGPRNQCEIESRPPGHKRQSNSHKKVKEKKKKMAVAGVEGGDWIRFDWHGQRAPVRRRLSWLALPAISKSVSWTRNSARGAHAPDSATHAPAAQYYVAATIAWCGLWSGRGVLGQAGGESRAAQCGRPSEAKQRAGDDRTCGQTRCTRPRRRRHNGIRDTPGAGAGVFAISRRLLWGGGILRRQKRDEM